MLKSRPKIRPRRVRVRRSAGGDVFVIRVADFPEGDRTGDAALAWREAWFHTWVCLPDLLDEPGPFDLAVEECAVPVPPEVGWDDEACATLMRPTLLKRELTLGQLGSAVLRYLRKSRGPLAVDIPL